MKSEKEEAENKLREKHERYQGAEARKKDIDKRFFERKANLGKEIDKKVSMAILKKQEHLNMTS